MNNKTIGIIAIVFGSLVLYSQEEYSWIISAIFIGIGTGIWFWKGLYGWLPSPELPGNERIGSSALNLCI